MVARPLVWLWRRRLLALDARRICLDLLLNKIASVLITGK